MDLSVSGLASGFDWKTLVDQLVQVERAPQTQLLSEQNLLQQRNNAYGSILTQLGVLRNRISALKSPDLFNTRAASVGDSSVASASASTGAVQGSFAFNFLQLATASKLTGSSGVGRALNASNDVSGLVLSNAGFASGVSAGDFTVNGKRVSIVTTDTLQQVFDKISAATGGTVTGGYDSSTDRISLNSGAEIVLGSAADSSNFLQIARLNNNGTGTVASSSQLGSVQVAHALSAANFTTAISDGGGAGKFRINGAEILFTASDKTADVLKRINDSAAGVTASFDSVNDRFTLVNKTTGDLGVALEDVSGNFLAAAGLSTGALQRGKSLLYTVNNGGTLTSQSNTITEASSGLAGLTVTALKEGGSTTVTVGSDTSKIKTAINDFITQYNGVQSLIDSQTASSTDAKGKVTAGILASDSDANDVARQLRTLAYGQVSGLTGTVKRLESLGIATNSKDNTLKLEDSTKLDAALANNLNDVSKLFTDPTSGIAAQLDTFLERTIGDNGSLLTRQTNLTKQSQGIDAQIAALESNVQVHKQELTSQFVAMETAQSRINQQLQYLTKSFG